MTAVDGDSADGVMAIVPLRDGYSGKSRLSGMLTPTERRHAVATMAHRVGLCLLDEPRISQVAVVTRDRQFAACALPDEGRVNILAQPAERPGLNAAAAIGFEHAITTGAARVLVIHADLPELNTADIAALLDTESDVVLAPDDTGEGTNAVVVGTSVDTFQFRFGASSYTAHSRGTYQCGVTLETVRRKGLATDLNTAADWKQLSPQTRLQLRRDTHAHKHGDQFRQ